MARRGRPPLPHPRGHGVFVRFSDTEWGALPQARQAEHPAPTRRPTPSEWIRDLMVAHASEVLQVEVTRAGLRHAPGGAPELEAVAPRPGGPPGGSAPTPTSPLTRSRP